MTNVNVASLAEPCNHQLILYDPSYFFSTLFDKTIIVATFLAFFIRTAGQLTENASQI